MATQRRYRSEREVREGSEADWQQRVIDYAMLNGWALSHHPDSRRVVGQRGLPDLLLCRRGRLIFAELKTEHGRLSVDQTFWKAELEAVAGYARRQHENWPAVAVYVWRPGDWEEVQHILA